MSKTVWVIDDNPAVAESILALLNTQGILGVAMTSGGQVLERLGAGEQPGVMLIDINMPDNGNKVLEQVVKVPAWTFPIIVLSGYDDPIHKDVVGRVYKVLTKPGEPLELVAHVKRALGIEM